MTTEEGAPPAAAETGRDEIWRAVLMGTDPEFRKARAFYKHLPKDPRCKMCGVPFAGPMATIMRMRVGADGRRTPSTAASASAS